jgi:hypothetical protein
MNIRQISFPDTQFIGEVFPKTQIYLHHTAGGPNADIVFHGWAQTRDRIATCVVISGDGPYDGEIVQGFSSKFWAYHLGVKNSHFSRFGLPFINLDRISIGIEICNWGQLTERKGRFFNYLNKEIPSTQVYELRTPHRGFKYYHNYTDAQIASTKELLLLWKERYDIPLTYNPDIWDVTPRALKGERGVFTHNSVRPDKVDVYPHHKLIEMLQTL